MIIKSKNFVLKLEEILKDKLPTKRFNEQEINVLRIIKSWYSDQSYFIHQTSGSTGRPKKLKISREKIVYSANATMQSIDPEGTINHSLLCINSQFIGGATVVYRALIFNHNLTILNPTTDIIDQLDGNDDFDLVSVAPLQFKKFDENDIGRFKIILIGGGPMPVISNESSTNIYSTFGMTETVSHIALREIDNDSFHTTGDTVVDANEDGTLRIKGTITDNVWLNTNDIVEVIDPTSFKWVGRKDFIINSGGIKVNPEVIEDLMKEQLSGDFIISSLPDDQLGEKIVLISSEVEKTLDFSKLPKYTSPKALYFNQEIVRTPSGKIDRLKTKQLFEETNEN